MNLLEELELFREPSFIILIIVLIGDFLFYYFVIKCIINRMN